MASIKSKKAIRACRAKVKYYTEEEVIAAVKALQKDGRVGARPYRCNGEFGKPAHWHITSGSKGRVRF